MGTRTIDYNDGGTRKIGCDKRSPIDTKEDAVKVSTRLIPCLLGVGLVALPTNAASADETYHINLSPAAHPGDKFQYIAAQTMTSNSYDTKGALTAQGSFSEVDFGSVAEVESCDAKGRPIRVKFKVQYLQMPNLGFANLINPGSEITARNALVQNEPPKFTDVFTYKDDPVQPLSAAALRRVVTIGSEKESSEQEAFGTDQALPIGGTWPLDGTPGAKLFEKMQLKVDPKDVIGNAQLAGKFFTRDNECLEVRIEVACDKYQPPVPADQKVEKGKVTGEVIYYIAKDTGRVVESSYRAHEEFDVSGKRNGVPFTFHTTKDTSRLIKISDAPK